MFIIVYYLFLFLLYTQTDYYDPESNTHNEDAYGTRPRSASTDLSDEGGNEGGDEGNGGNDGEGSLEASLESNDLDGGSLEDTKGQGFGLSADSGDNSDQGGNTRGIALSGADDLSGEFPGGGAATEAGTDAVATTSQEGPLAMEPPPPADSSPSTGAGPGGFFSKLSAKLIGSGKGSADKYKEKPDDALAKKDAQVGGKPLKSNIRRISADRPDSQQSQASSKGGGGFDQTAGTTEKRPTKV